MTAAGASLRTMIGDEAFQRLVAWRGGRRLRVPRKASGLEPIIDALGERAALALFESAAGDEFDVPRMAKRGGPGISTLRVERLRDRGLRADEIARELRVTRRTVSNHLAKARATA